MLQRNVALLLLSIFVFLPVINVAQQPTATPVVIPATQQPAQRAPAKDPNDPIERIKDEGTNLRFRFAPPQALCLHPLRGF